MKRKLAIALMVLVLTATAACSSSSKSEDAGKIPPGATVWTSANGGNGHGYMLVVVQNGIKWEDASAAASAAGGHLVTISTTGENAFVVSLASADMNAWITVTSGAAAGASVGPWLGASAQNSSWSWVTGESWSYADWAPGQPSGTFMGMAEDKLELLGAVGSNGALQVAGWNDVSDFAAPSYVVEFE